MAKPRKTRSTRGARRSRLLRQVWRWTIRVALAVFAFILLVVMLFAVVNPPRGVYMSSEARRLGEVERAWVPMERISPHMQRSAVAAEDANFCEHWGFDMHEIRRALDQRSGRGASTISQQVVKNVYLWHGRNWSRKALEAIMTPVVETIWSKRRILEVYLNVAEFDEGIFGVEAAARHYFGTTAADLSATQAARLAAVLPNPKERSASRPSDPVRRRTAAIMDGAATIRADGRSRCFEG